MNKEKALRIILIASLPMMLLIWGKRCGYFAQRGESQATAVPAAAPGQPAQPSETPLVFGKRQARHTKYTTWGRPPFRVGEIAQSEAAPLTLEGIVMDPL